MKICKVCGRVYNTVQKDTCCGRHARTLKTRIKKEKIKHEKELRRKSLLIDL